MAILSKSRLARECKAAIARNKSLLSEREIGVAFIELYYEKELVKEVDSYQWHQTDAQWQ